MDWRTSKPFLYFLFALLMEHSALIGEGIVVPNNPSASALYPCLPTAGIANRLPLGQSQLPAGSIETIRNWILAGVPDWAVPSSPSNRFIYLTVIEPHLMPLTPFNCQFACYFTTPHLYNAGERTDILHLIRFPRRSMTQKEILGRKRVIVNRKEGFDDSLLLTMIHGRLRPFLPLSAY